MGKHEKLLLKILSATSDASIQFEDLCRLLRHLGFAMRVKGSHHIFRKETVVEKINLQRDGIWQNLMALKNAKDAIKLWINTANEFDDPIPEPKGNKLIYA